MVTYVRKETADVVTGVELTTAKKAADDKADEDKAEKAKKQVGVLIVCLVCDDYPIGQLTE